MSKMSIESDTSVQSSTIAGEQPNELRTEFESEVAFRAWYERSLPRVYAYVFHRCGRDPSLAEELTQQAFVEAVRTRARFRGRSDAVTWIISIARHKLVDHFRRADRDRRRLSELGARELVGQPSPVWDQTPRDEIDEALGLLPGYQRAVLVLHYMDGLSVRDVSKAIGKSEAATASLLARGRDAFRDAYHEVIT